MTFQNLISTPDVTDYFDLDLKDSLIVYLHVPKAAGNSSIKPIKEHFKNNLSIKWNEIDNSWANFVKNYNINKDVQFVSGHIHDKHIDLLIESKINYFLISFIRHPIHRIESLYAYNTMPSTPNSSTFKNKFKSFEEFAYDGVPPNSMSRQLFRGCLSSSEGIKKLYSKYNFIGLTEMFHFSMLCLSDIVGFKYYNYKRLNVSKYTDNKLQLSYGILKDLEKRHSIDIDIYNHIKNDYLKLVESYISNKILINENSR